MPDTLHIVCPHCDAVNRVPAAKLSAGGRCGKCHQTLYAGHPASLDDRRFATHLDKSDVPLLVDFWAPWCGPCRGMAPAFERVAARLEPQLRLVKINIDENPAAAQRFAVQSIPTLVLARHGRELGRLVGAQTEARLVSWVQDHLPL